MCHQRRRLAEETVFVIRIAVTSGIRFQFSHPVYLRAVLREMRLYRKTCFGSVLTHGAEHLVRTRWDEPRCDNRFYQTFLAMFVKMRFKHTHALYHFRCRVLQRIRTIAVHAHKPHISTHTRLDKDIRQNTCRFRMDGGKYRRTHCALHPKFMYETTVQPAGISRIGIFGLLRECICIEPRQQFQVQCQTHVAVLRSMDVKVVKSGNKQFVPEIQHLATRIHVLRQFAIDSFYQTVRTHDNIAVRDDFQFPGRRGVNDIRSVYFHIIFS